MTSAAAIASLRARHGLGAGGSPQPEPPAHAIARLAAEIAERAPGIRSEALRIVALAGGLTDCVPVREDIVEAVEEVLGEEAGGCCVARIAEAVMRACRRA